MDFQKSTYPVTHLASVCNRVSHRRSLVHQVCLRVPRERGGISSEITIVHLERKGLRPTEARVSVTRDGRLCTTDIRNPLHYESEGEIHISSLPFWDRASEIVAFVRSADFKALAGSSRRELPRCWHSDNWYVCGERVPQQHSALPQTPSRRENSLTGLTT